MTNSESANGVDAPKNKIRKENPPGPYDVRTMRANTRFIEIDGEVCPIWLWAYYSQTPEGTIRKRLQRGWPVFSAVFGRTGDEKRGQEIIWRMMTEKD